MSAPLPRSRLTPRALLLAPLRLVYALWGALVFLTVGLAALALLALLPGIARRRAAARRCARVLLGLAGMPVTLRHTERLPAGQCVVVCNHASYLDGVVLTAALPARFAFVIKREMAAVPLAGALLRRLGSEFVERTDRNRSAVDARRVLRNATSGHSLVFFPEGTFTPSPGLLRGTRRALPPSGALPRPGRLAFEILPSITPEASEPDAAAAELRDRARAAILEALGEPDLTYCADTGRPPDTAPA
jgi:1-acyl-sn-glycerol-3-phosphate acyltransferase